MSKTHLEHPSQATACGAPSTQVGVSVDAFRAAANKCGRCARTLAAIEAGRPRYSGLVQLLDGCYLCSVGFPLRDDGMHYGTQALGMIPDTKCSGCRCAEPSCTRCKSAARRAQTKETGR